MGLSSFRTELPTHNLLALDGTFSLEVLGFDTETTLLFSLSDFTEVCFAS
jgi:hypothetical protein